MPRLIDLLATSSRKSEIIDLTPQVMDAVANGKFSHGVCFLFLTRTTAALTVAALEPGAGDDILEALNRIVPAVVWRHQPAEHVPAHLVSAIVGVSTCVPVDSGRLVLGEFQRIVLIELNGPRQTRVRMNFLPAL